MSDIHVFYVSAGLLTSQHRNRIGESLWEFLWLVSHETKLEGKVLNGSPITLKRIAEELGESSRTVRRNLDRLERGGYIAKNRVNAGHVYCYSIAHSKKWRQFVAAARNVPSSTVELRPDMSNALDINVHSNKESRQVDSIYIKPTICTKCSGRGIYPELVPSELNPEIQVEKWVKCVECCSEERPNPS